MNRSALALLDDASLRRALTAVVAAERTASADVLAHLAEFDARRLFVAAGCSTVFAYCVEELHYSESAALKRIQAARAARRFPRLFADLAEGRLHLAAVGLIAPHLTPENADELVEAATHRTKAEVETWLARRFAPADGPATPAPRAKVIAVRVPAPRGAEAPADPLFTPGVAESHSPGNVISHAAPVVRHVLQIPLDVETQALLREVQDLLGHAVAPGDLGAVFRRALEGLRTDLLRRKAGAVARPRPRQARPQAKNSRLVSAPVRRTVWERDQGRCTFTSDGGRRCSATRALEYDHVVPHARGGEATVEGLRLRCRAHNQYEAERAFGTEFMRRKREAARERQTPDPDVEAALRTLGCRAAEARRGAVHAAGLAGAPVADRLRAALQFVGAGARAVLAPRSA